MSVTTTALSQIRDLEQPGGHFPACPTGRPTWVHTVRVRGKARQPGPHQHGAHKLPRDSDDSTATQWWLKMNKIRCLLMGSRRLSSLHPRHGLLPAPAPVDPRDPHKGPSITS